ncbi:MAG: hypothetical protein V7718_01075 [Porticoccus sp.]
MVVLALSGSYVAVFAEETVPEVRTPELPTADIDLSDWGIYNGCISNNRILGIKVLDTNAALLELVNGKQVVMRFMGSCRGIKQYGFVYTARNNLFCAKRHSVRVMEIGTHCQVESLEPYQETGLPRDGSQE